MKAKSKNFKKAEKKNMEQVKGGDFNLFQNPGQPTGQVGLMSACIDKGDNLSCGLLGGR